jgi:hypothetical protein
MANNRHLRSAVAAGALTIATLSLIGFAAKSSSQKALTLVGGQIDDVAMSYEMEVSPHCADCLSYAVRTDGRVVTFSCRNCAVHEVSFVVDAAVVASMAREFIDSRFFSMPRLGEGYPRSVDHATSFVWSYRDARRTHEVKTLRTPSHRDLQRLREKMESIGRVQYFTTTPPDELIRELLKRGNWNPSSAGLAYLAQIRDKAAVQLLLDYDGGFVGGKLTAEVLEAAARGGDPEILTALIEHLPEAERAAASAKWSRVLR